VDTLKIEQYLEIGLQIISRKRREHVEKLTRAERVRMALEEFGPTFVKLGQILSSRPDLIPVEFIQKLSKLQDHVHPFSYAEVKYIIESELGAPIGYIFQHFEQTPLAAASIGQVNRAQLRNSEEVVAKVQRPGIHKTIDVDLEIMLHLASLMERHLEEAELQHPTKIVEEFAHTMERELDYTIEASHIERFASQFMDDQTIYVPKVYRETTTTRVLTMEYVDGIKASEIDQLQSASLDQKEIAHRGADLILKQIFDYGFFHADPHPGNVYILPNNVICYLDFGMMGRIDRQTRENFADLVMSIVSRDEGKIADALLKLTLWEDEPDRSTLERELGEFMDLHFYRPLKELELGKLLRQLLDMASKHRLRVPPDLFLMLKALSTVESLGSALDPDFDMETHAAPSIRRIQRERLHLRRVAADMFDTGSEIVSLIKDIPRELREILKQARQGKLKLEFEHRGLESMLTTHDRISNRIAFAIVLASLVIGSSLIILADVPPKWYGIPDIGLAGFLVAGVMGF